MRIGACVTGVRRAASNTALTAPVLGDQVALAEVLLLRLIWNGLAPTAHSGSSPNYAIRPVAQLTRPAETQNQRSPKRSGTRALMPTFAGWPYAEQCLRGLDPSNRRHQDRAAKLPYCPLAASRCYPMPNPGAREWRAENII